MGKCLYLCGIVCVWVCVWNFIFIDFLYVLKIITREFFNFVWIFYTNGILDMGKVIVQSLDGFGFNKRGYCNYGTLVMWKSCNYANYIHGYKLYRTRFDSCIEEDYYMADDNGLFEGFMFFDTIEKDGRFKIRYAL